MRCSSTVSAPVQHCCAPLTAHHSRYIAVQLLTNQVLYFIAETKSKAKDVYAQTCIYLAGQGMLDCELFGLAIMCDGEYLFVDPECKLSKYAPKNWKSSSSHGLDGYGKPVFVLYFRVQFYVDTPLLLRDDITRHNYYLQLRENAVTRGQVSFCSSDELLLLLGGYALQADFGDYNESEHRRSYFQLEKYFPKELISRNTQIFKTAVALHKDNHGLTAAEAEMQYIKEASSAEITPLTYNVHLYKLKSHKKQEMDQTTVWLAICARGIQIYEETHLRKSLSTVFLWNNIGKLCFDRKKFEIKALSTSAEKLTYYTNSDDKSKHLLFLCRVTHQFSMTVQTRLSEAKRKEEERKKYRDCFAYNRGLNSEFQSLAKINLNSSSYKNMRSDQRTSVISNTSSNTTSGIVSDRVQSLDESEDDLEMEIMINSPPGNSVESLALAHLKDPPSCEENDCPDSLSHPEDATDSCVTGTHCTQKSSPSIGGGAATPATTDGSQCSSSCSTVVITGVSGNSSCLNISLSTSKLQKNIPRRSSTTSSLELGYSHTAQNSVVSDSISCLELDLSVQNTHFSISGKIENVCSKESEVYSLQTIAKGRGDIKASSYLFNRTNEVEGDTNFIHESTVSDLETASSGIYMNASSKNSNIYKRSIRSDSENTHQAESDFSNRMATHLSNGSDLETSSSGVYTNSNDLESSRIHSPTDLDNANSEIFTMRSTTEPDLQTNVCSSETSGVYLGNSIADNSSTSDCCGVYAIMESMRERSSSNASRLSTSGSFHGDGSDPSEAKKGTLLTAEELSDLIVGKAHNSGSYPLRATISNTLDSDSDYVTLPPPPRPPPRIDSEFRASVSRPDRPPPAFPENLRPNYLGPEKLKRPDSLQNLPRQNLFLMQSRENVIDRQRQFDEQCQQSQMGSKSESPLAQYSSPLTSLLAQIGPSSTLPSPTEEANARLVTTKPHISMITHSNLPSVSVAPNFASVTHTNFALNFGDTTRTSSDNPPYASESAIYNSFEQNPGIYPSAKGLSSNLTHVPISQKPYFRNIENPNCYGSDNLSFEPSVKRYQNKNCQCDPGAKMKLNSVPMVPIVGANNYLDVHASKGKNLLPLRGVTYHRTFSSIPPPVGIPRQPPPPPPPLATVYTSQVTRSQIEQFKQQLYSDVDYVIYPMKDPAISKQEYIDAKQGSLLAAMATGYPHLYPPPPPYPSAKTHVVYRSTPNVALGNGYLPVNFKNQPLASACTSNTHLNQSSEQLYGYQTYLPQPSHYSSASPLYSAASYSSSSSQSLRYDPAQVTDYFLQHPLSSIPGNSLNFSRTRSDDNILNFYQKPTHASLEKTKCRRFPPPPPPPPYEMPQRMLYAPDSNIHLGVSKVNSKIDANTKKAFRTEEEKKLKLEVKKEQRKCPSSPSSSATKTITDDKGKIIDFHSLIEKSKNLDLPLISALCNDKSLIRQTNAFVMPKHPGANRCSSGHGLKAAKPLSKKIVDKERPLTFHSDSKNATPDTQKTPKISENPDGSPLNTNCSKTTKTATLLENLFSGKSSKRYSSSSKFKYPVSGLSTTQISKPQRKLSSAHVHPKDSKAGQSGGVVGKGETQAKTAVSVESKDSIVP